MKKVCLVILCVGVLLSLGGCLELPNYETTIPEIPEPPEATDVTEEQVITEPTVRLEATGDGGIGIGYPKVFVGSNLGMFSGGGYYRGGQAEHVLPIHNTSLQPIQVQLFFQSPQQPEDGYISAPAYVQSWVMFSEDTPTIAPNSVKEVMVTLKMPKDASVFAPKWEFVIMVLPMGQGNVQVSVGQRWLVTMR